MKKRIIDLALKRSFLIIAGGFLSLCLLCTVAFADKQPRKRALLISIGRYEASNKPLDEIIPPLHAEDEKMVDTELMKKALDAHGFEVTVLPAKESTNEGIRRAIEKLQSEVSEGDVILIYYSGHGSVVVDKLAICPYDTARRDGAKDIDSDEILKWVKELRERKALNVTLVFDCCFVQVEGTTMDPAHYKKAVPARRGAKVKYEEQQQARQSFEDKMSQAHAVVLTAADVGEDAIQELKGNQSFGLFTKHLTDALLNPDSQTWSYEQLTEEVTKSLKADLKKRYPRSNYTQTPRIYGANDQISHNLFMPTTGTVATVSEKPNTPSPTVSESSAIQLNQEGVYKVGDKLVATILPEQDGYLTLIVIDEKGQVNNFPPVPVSKKVNYQENLAITNTVARGNYTLVVFVSSQLPDTPMVESMKKWCLERPITQPQAVERGGFQRNNNPPSLGFERAGLNPAWITTTEGFTAARRTFKVH